MAAGLAAGVVALASEVAVGGETLAVVVVGFAAGVVALAAGVAAGAYEQCLKYVLERKQFGKPVAQFQLI